MTGIKNKVGRGDQSNQSAVPCNSKSARTINEVMPVTRGFANRPEQNVMDAIRDLYDLDTVAAARRISSDPLTLAYKIETQKGDFCLKRHRPEKTPPQLTIEETLLSALGERGFDLVPRLIATRSGQLHFALEEDLWSLYRFIESGRSFLWTNSNWNTDHCRAAGAGLAQFHFHAQQVAQQVDEAVDDDETKGSALPHLASWLTSAMEKAASWVASDAGKDDLRLRSVIDLRAELFGMLAIAQEQLWQNRDSAWTAGDPTLVHGDYHPANLLFRGTELAGIIDFDHTHFEHRQYDLGYASVLFCAPWDMDEEAVGHGCLGRFDARFLDALLSSYLSTWQQISSSDEHETVTTQLRQIHPYMSVACYLLLYWLLDRYPEQTPAIKPHVWRAINHSLKLLFSLQQRIDG